ncbi:MAG: PAS domain S-box protein, partial [Alphaproteobacteria bacterium]|nr:PAS domain S-box protein [Alphaproteobacteria bacterium]
MKPLSERFLESGRDRLQAIVNSALDGLITIDAVGAIETFNPACERIFGYNAEEVMGQNVKMLMPEPYHSEHDGYIRHYRETGDARIIGTAGREVSGRRKDGSIFPMELSVSAFGLEDGQHYCGIIRDVTLRHEAARALLKSEQRYDLVVRGMSVGLWDWNVENGTLYWTEKFRSFLGIADPEYKPSFEDFAARLHPDDKERTLQMLFGHLARLGPYNIEHRVKRDDGKYVWIHASGQALWDSDGHPVRMVGSAADISRDKASELQIKEDAARMAAVMDTVLDGLITINAHGAIQSFNPAAVRVFGYAPEEVVGKNVKMLMPEPYHSGHDEYLRHYLATGEKKVIGIGREVSAKRKDGSIFPIELGISEMEVEGERMFVGTIRDITERKRSEQEARRYLASLKRSNQELDDFAHIASHDLKEPLRGLSNNALFLKEDYGEKLNADGIKRLDRMVYLCARMERLVNDLLYFSRLGRQELAVQETDLNAVVKDIVSMMDTTLHEAHATVRIDGIL